MTAALGVTCYRMKKNLIIALACIALGCESKLNVDCRELRENENGLVLFRFRVFTGTCNTYYKRGDLEKIFHWKNGQLNGVQTEFHQNGKMKAQFKMINGLVHGRYVTFYKSGIKEMEGIYHNGLQQGIWNRFDESGNVIEILHWNKGELTKTESLAKQKI